MAAGLGLLTALSVGVNGYHFGIEDQAIYLPAVLKDLDPSLFPYDHAFFDAQTKPTLIDELVAGIVRFGHLPLEWVLFVLHLLSIWLLLFGASRVIRRCFHVPSAVWGGLGLLSGLLLLPIAGTSQYLADQYLHPRTLATGLILLPVADLLPGPFQKRGKSAVLWCLLSFVPAVLLQLQMAIFGLGFLFCLLMPWERWIPAMKPAMLTAVPFGAILQLFERGSPAWQEAARTRDQHYLVRWTWYEWLGITAPMVVFWLWAKIGDKQKNEAMSWFCRRISVYGTLVLVIGSALILPPAFERLTPVQPMRMFTFVYLYMLVIGGGLLGQYVLRTVVWRWLVLFIPLVAGMYHVNRQAFPSMAHIEWPGIRPANDWEQTFLWIRQNTPKDAYFAVNPHYLRNPGEDFRGFRAWAWRGNMADWEKDAAVASLVPSVAPRWQKEMHARDGWESFSAQDFARLKRDFGVNWALLENRFFDENGRKMPDNLECPYRNESLSVCRIR